MTGFEASAVDLEPRSAQATGVSWRVSSSRLPQPFPVIPVEDDAVLPDDDDPWLEDEDPDEDGSGTEPKRPFWNR